MSETGSLNWLLFILQWFIRFSELAEFLFHLGKTPLTFFNIQRFIFPCHLQLFDKRGNTISSNSFFGIDAWENYTVTFGTRMFIDTPPFCGSVHSTNIKERMISLVAHHFAWVFQIFNHLQTKFAKVMFLQVSVCPQGRVSMPRTREASAQGGSRPRTGGHVQIQAQEGCVSQHALRQTPPSADGYCCERFASYWNAFLSMFNLTSRVLNFEQKPVLN